MKYHHINKDKIFEMYINEPHEYCDDIPFDVKSHGWQVVIIMGYDIPSNSLHAIKIDKNSEKECVDFIDSFGLKRI